MSLSPGSRLGAYEVTAKIGAGGMGEVYRATDTTLGRQVAIKILPEAFAADPDRLARFEREAKTLASLNHPNIAAIYGVEKSPDGFALVMELVEGEDLDQRIAGSGRRGSDRGVPLDEALPMARQIAQALEAAHEQGIIHRDLKPANIKVRPDGTVKVLDFGLAKALDPSPSAVLEAAGSALSMSPTMTSPAMTSVGMILGTAAYMSPEQARGRPIDRRTDVWAFGCVLFEMLTGRRVFDGGETVSDAVAAILKTEPDWSALPAATPPHIRVLLGRCLQKDPQKRLPHIGVARLEIDEGARDGGGRGNTHVGAPGAPPQPSWRRAVLLGAAVLVTAVATSVAWWTLRPAASTEPITRFFISLPEGERFTALVFQSVAISPDGSKLVWVANNRLYVRSLSELEGAPIAGSEAPLSGVSSPVFSPDGQSVAYFSAGAIKTIGVAGGVAVTLCPAPELFGMSWAESGIVFGEGKNGVMRVSPGGGTPERLLAVKDGEVAHGPQVLPGGKSLLVTLAESPIAADSWDRARIVVQTIGTAEQKTIITGGGDARYVPTGHLLYASGGTLMAVAFDPGRLEATSGPVPVVDGVRRVVGGGNGTVQVTTSQTGTLAFLPGPTSLAAAQQDIGLVDRKGVVQLLKLPPGLYQFPRVSPDGTRIAFGANDGHDADVWIYDLNGKTSARRLTFGGKNMYPLWSADSRRVAFQSDREGDLGIWWQAADGGGTAERLTKAEPGTAHFPESWSPANSLMLYSALDRSLTTVLRMVSLQDRKTSVFGEVASKGGNLTSASFSPDGKWVAYADNATANSVTDNNVYVQPFPATGAKYQISKAGENGHDPMWSPDGKELFYVPQVGQFVSVSVATDRGFTFGNPVPVARAFPVASPATPRPFDIMADGRIVSIVASGQTVAGVGPQQIEVVLNWFEELKAKVTASRR